MDKSQMEFNYGGAKTIIQCREDEKLKDIFKIFKSKVNAENKTLIYKYNGNIIQNEEYTFNEIANVEDKKRNKMNILVNENISKTQQNYLIKSKNIICPECKEDIKIKIQDYEINLFECKNKHNINHISFDEFNSTQYIDTSKIICRNCETYNKVNSKDNKFYRCNFCKKNFCPICISDMIKIMIL